MSFWVYILRCADKSYYTGHTDNLEKRISEHQAGEGNGYTSTRLPVALVFSQEFTDRDQALVCELQIKGWSRRKKEALMRGDWAEVSRQGQALRQAQGERKWIRLSERNIRTEAQGERPRPVSKV
jgi:putative endonuclease